MLIHYIYINWQITPHYYFHILMSVLLQTSYGDLTIDFFTSQCPTASKNFLKLCRFKHYNNALFINVQKDYLTQIQTSRPTTIYKQIFGEEDYQYFEDEIDMEIKMNKVGLVCTRNEGPNMNNSEFFITLTDRNLTSLYGKHTVFGEVVDGVETLKRINQSILDKTGRPLLNVRILHTHVLEDPYCDLVGMKNINVQSPILERDPDRLQVSQHEEMLSLNKTQKDIEKATREQKAKKQAKTLEMLGDLPDADAKPAENILFVCKLNPITVERDLQLIFSRFGNIKNCEIVRDWKTGQSLQYAFIEYETPQSCEEAYLKMQRATIDNRRIEVDFSQSVAMLKPKSWGKKEGKRPGGGQREGRTAELEPKYREGKEIYGEKSSKYELIIGERRKEVREEGELGGNDGRKLEQTEGREKQERKRKRSRSSKRERSKQKQRQGRSKQRSRERKRKQSNESGSARSVSQSKEKKRKDKHEKKSKKEKYRSRSRSASDRKHKKKSKHHRD